MIWKFLPVIVIGIIIVAAFVEEIPPSSDDINSELSPELIVEVRLVL